MHPPTHTHTRRPWHGAGLVTHVLKLWEPEDNGPSHLLSWFLSLGTDPTVAEGERRRCRAGREGQPCLPTAPDGQD